MLRYFNSAYFSRTVVLVFLAALIWLPSFLLPSKMAVSLHPAPLYQFFLFITGNNVYLHLSIAFVLSIVSALLLNQIATEYGFTEKISQLGTFVYILFSGALLSYTTMSTFILTNLLMLFFLQSLLKIAEAKEPLPLAFNASFILGMSALFYLPSLVFILLIWISLIVFRVGQWRNYMVSLIGLLLPLVFAFTWYFWNDQLTEAYSLFNSTFRFHMPYATDYSVTDWGIVVLLLVFILVSVIKTSNSLMEMNINVRQILLVSMYYLAIVFVLVLFFSMNASVSLLVVVPASLITASTLTLAKKTKWYEWTLKLVLIFILFNQYSRLFYAA